jgi:signal transduction histidine kinase
MRRLHLLLWPAGIALGLAAEGVAFGWGDPRHWVPDLAVGWSFIGCGLLASARRPESRVGPFMSATGFTWFLGNFVHSGIGVVDWVAARTIYLHRGPLVHLVLAYPTGLASTKLSRGAVAAGYAAALLTFVWRDEAATIVLGGLLVAIAASEYARAVGRSRRARVGATWATTGLGLVLAAGAAARLAIPGGDAVAPASLAYQVVLIAIACGLLIGLLSASWERAAVTDLVVELGEARSGTLRGELASALGDPTLELGYWLPESDAFVDTDGRPMSLPESGSERSVTRVERDGRPIAALVHDPSVLGDPGLLEAVASAAQLAASNARLQAEVRAQVAELVASRRRLVEAGDQERRRLERRLHDGTEQRLGQMQETLGRIRREASGDETRAKIDRAESQLERTLEDLSRLAQGLHPRILSERGLEGALLSVAERSEVPVDISVTGNLLPPGLEAAAYFVCSEALANVGKYASASRATISVSTDDSRVRMSVEDDGVGGADLSRGSGLRGLADRVEALGGTLHVDSPPGHGTRLVAEIPVGDENQ